MTPDPYEPHLRQADTLFAQGDIVKAGQIWQAVLKQQPTHTEARERLMVVKQRLLALREAEAAAPAASASPAPEPPAPEPPALAPAPPEATAERVIVPEPEAPPAVLPDPEPALPAVAHEPEPPAPEPALLVVPPPVEALPEALASPEPEALAAPFAEPVIPPPHPRDARSTAPEPMPLVEQAKVITGNLDPERLVAEGCTLYDMGQLEDALRKWEGALALDPAHALALGYANGARRELGLSPLHPTHPQEPAQGAVHHVDEDVDKLLREAVQLYDMGLTEEAITKWERVLTLEPHRQEIEGYLRNARREVTQAASAPTGSAQVQTSATDQDSLDLKLRQAEHLLTLQRHEEAAFTFQQALSLAPGNARALQGLERCRKPSSRPATDSGSAPRPMPAPMVTLDAQGRIAMVEEGPSGSTEPQGVEPPAALLKAVPTPRKGLSLPERMDDLTQQMPWLKDTRIIAGVGGGLLVLILGFWGYRSYRQDQALKDDVQSARAAAVAPVAQQAQAPNLGDSPADIRQEAEIALGTDPLRAFLRAETLVATSPSDASGAQLLEKARAGLPGGVTGASLPEFQKHMQNGDLEAAEKVMNALLRAEPSDAGLRFRAGRLHLLLCSAHASQTKWEEAQDDLLRGRALFPSDKSWNLRMKLLEQIKAMPKDQRAAWIVLLG